MGPIIASAIGAISNIFSVIFKTKEAKATAIAEGVKAAVDVLKQADATDGQIATAVASAVTAEAQSEGFITRNWRPFVMLLLAALIVGWAFGYIPPNINQPMPPFVAECFDLLKFGLGLYLPGRTLEKVAKMVLTPKLIETIANKVMK